MNLLLPRTPAYLDLLPKKLNFYILNKGEIFKKLYASFGSGEYYSTQPKSKKILPFYLLKKGRKYFFLKVIPLEHKEKFFLSDKISHFLNRINKTELPTIIEKKTLSFKDKYLIFSYKYIKGNLPKSSNYELINIAAELAKLHFGLNKIKKKISSKKKQSREIRFYIKSLILLLSNKHILVISLSY